LRGHDRLLIHVVLSLSEKVINPLLAILDIHVTAFSTITQCIWTEERFHGSGKGQGPII